MITSSYDGLSYWKFTVLQQMVNKPLRSDVGTRKR